LHGSSFGHPAPSKGFQWASIALIPSRSLEAAPSGSTSSAEPPDAPVKGYNEAFDQIKSRYYGPLPSENAMTYGAIRGMLRTLGDRYTRFLDPEQFRRLEEENSGEFGGIGATVALNAKNQAIVQRIDAGGPAFKAGLRANDVVLSVSGHPIYPGHAAAERTEDLLHGNPGTTVSVKISRKGSKSRLEFVVKRQMAYTPTVTFKMLKDGVGYIKLESFGERSDEEVGTALRKLRSLGMKALIFDMRGNPGGYFNSAIDIASRFIDHGPVVFTKDREDRRIPVPNIPSKRLMPPVPLAVLVDRWSASAAEIVAAAIQDNGAGMVIGQPTYGKALVQRINPIPDGSALLVTTDHYYTPRGLDISHKGVKPNIVLAASPSNTSASDKAFQRALVLLSPIARAASRPRVSQR
jgi:carboxyl-terminal processing protease